MPKTELLPLRPLVPVRGVYGQILIDCAGCRAVLTWTTAAGRGWTFDGEAPWSPYRCAECTAGEVETEGREVDRG
jgi:hypothetical protein